MSTFQQIGCETCGRTLQASTTRPRRYCCAACRTRAWRIRNSIVPSVTNPIDTMRAGATLQVSKTDCPTGISDTGPQLRQRPRRSAL